MTNNQQEFLQEMRQWQNKAERNGSVRDIRQIMYQLKDFGLKKMYDRK